jgi:hypothetical protein
MPKADPRSARKRQRSKGRPSARPTSKEYQQALDEIDTLSRKMRRQAPEKRTFANVLECWF